MPFQIIRNDITKVRVDAIVNTANPEPVYAGGTDAAVYFAAGEDKLLAERRKIGRINPGEAAVTPAFALPAKYIIHTVGPVWEGGDRGEYDQLASCYRNSLLLALRLGCESIAFPLISTGVYGFPRDQALDIALREISSFLENSEMDVTLVVFDRKSFDISARLSADVRQYIDEHYAETRSTQEYAIDNLRIQNRIGRRSRRSRRKDSALPEEEQDSFLMEQWGQYAPSEYKREAAKTADAMSLADQPAPPAQKESAKAQGAVPTADQAGGLPLQSSAPRPQRSLQDVISQVGETFQECLLRMIDERGLTDVQVYKRANIDRKLFSKIRCNPGYMPRRKTVISLAVALELNMDEMVDLLSKAGIALSPGNKFDLIIRYCIENRIYDTMTINSLLFDYDQPLLGA